MQKKNDKLKSKIDLLENAGILGKILLVEKGGVGFLYYL